MVKLKTEFYNLLLLKLNADIITNIIHTPIAAKLSTYVLYNLMHLIFPQLLRTRALVFHRTLCIDGNR